MDITSNAESSSGTSSYRMGIGIDDKFRKGVGSKNSPKGKKSWLSSWSVISRKGTGKGKGIGTGNVNGYEDGQGKMKVGYEVKEEKESRKKRLRSPLLDRQKLQELSERISKGVKSKNGVPSSFWHGKSPLDEFPQYIKTPDELWRKESWESGGQMWSLPRPLLRLTRKYKRWLWHELVTVILSKRRGVNQTGFMREMSEQKLRVKQIIQAREEFHRRHGNELRFDRLCVVASCLFRTHLLLQRCTAEVRALDTHGDHAAPELYGSPRVSQGVIFGRSAPEVNVSAGVCPLQGLIVIAHRRRLSRRLVLTIRPSGNMHYLLSPSDNPFRAMSTNTNDMSFEGEMGMGNTSQSQSHSQEDTSSAVLRELTTALNPDNEEHSIKRVSEAASAFGTQMGRIGFQMQNQSVNITFEDKVLLGIGITFIKYLQSHNASLSPPVQSGSKVETDDDYHLSQSTSSNISSHDDRFSKKASTSDPPETTVVTYDRSDLVQECSQSKEVDVDINAGPDKDMTKCQSYSQDYPLVSQFDPLCRVRIGRPPSKTVSNARN
ncbi:hypothetical protein TREMEDRAFT_64423 [Tremella mesenterica DSM 1558]|uniref:uncharacterized protein n=1 Tax=Tremella mesenterica (strain ATCC 24925 / CBS 8224 / DSM 1558 / NBRC 9311 / NRRL Y-6157 / RJB 2259-6 / UBC 559-6) TaxID=578456 RepID=UPI0003F4A0C6|nr:uncharacterized protein TREMEDRAFT_64423 [Tremella mesenterica DSM 1558]EIW67183.1 hypothetical protein TREMEDRAFT_64423 [Tremella mesenterica DSM 1558]